MSEDLNFKFQILEADRNKMRYFKKEMKIKSEECILSFTAEPLFWPPNV